MGQNSESPRRDFLRNAALGIGATTHDNGCVAGWYVSQDSGRKESTTSFMWRTKGWACIAAIVVGAASHAQSRPVEAVVLGRVEALVTCLGPSRAEEDQTVMGADRDVTGQAELAPVSQGFQVSASAQSSVSD